MIYALIFIALPDHLQQSNVLETINTFLEAHFPGGDFVYACQDWPTDDGTKIRFSGGAAPQILDLEDLKKLNGNFILLHQFIQKTFQLPRQGVWLVNSSLEHYRCEIKDGEAHVARLDWLWRCPHEVIEELRKTAAAMTANYTHPW